MLVAGCVCCSAACYRKRWALAPRFERSSLVVLGHIDVELCRTRVFVPQRALHDMERVAVLHHLDAACMPELVNSVQRLALGVEQRGCMVRWARVSTTEAIQANGDSGIGAPAQNGLVMKVDISIIRITLHICYLVYIGVTCADRRTM